MQQGAARLSSQTSHSFESWSPVLRLLPAYDQGGCQTRYFLVGTLTWAVPLEIKKREEEEEKLEEYSEGLPEIEEAEDEDEKEEKEAEAEGGNEVLGGGREGERNEEEEDSLLADLADLADDEEAGWHCRCNVRSQEKSPRPSWK